MLGHNRKHMHAPAAKTRLQALDQRGHRITTSAFTVLTEQAARTSWQRLRRLGSQADRVDSGGQFEPLQALDEHPGDPFGVARGSAESEGQNSGRSLLRGTFVRKLEAAFTDSLSASSKPATQAGDQATPGKAESDRIISPHRQFQPLDKALRKNKARPRVRKIAERTRQICDKSGAESTCQTCAGQTKHVSEQARTKAAEASLLLRREVESRQRQSAEAQRQFSAVETGLIVAGKRQPLRSERRGSKRRLRSKALLGAAAYNTFEERRGAAEKTQGSGHFQQQRLGWQAADLRGETACPVGEPGQG